MSKIGRGASNFIRGGLRRFGYDICWADERRDPLRDLKTLAQPSPLIFDVGANLGQTIDDFRSAFKTPTIHAFEPGEIAFGVLQRDKAYPNVTLNKTALGAQKAKRDFIERVQFNMSSFLETGAEGYGDEASRIVVQIDTVDDYCDQKQISKIDILKSDTQGFELEVLKGAERTISRGALDLILLEMNFAELYKGQSAADEIMKFLRERNYSIVAFYRFVYVDGHVSWTDVLFRHSAPK